MIMNIRCRYSDLFASYNPIGINDDAQLARFWILVLFRHGGVSGIGRKLIRALLAAVLNVLTNHDAAGGTACASMQDAKLIGHTAPVGGEEGQHQK